MVSRRGHDYIVLPCLTFATARGRTRRWRRYFGNDACGRPPSRREKSLSISVVLLMNDVQEGGREGEEMLDAKPNGRRCRDTVTDRVCRRSPLERDLKIEVKAGGKAVKSESEERALLRVLVPLPPSKKSSPIQFGLSIMVRQASGRTRGERERAGERFPLTFVWTKATANLCSGRSTQRASERQRERERATPPSLHPSLLPSPPSRHPSHLASCRHPTALPTMFAPLFTYPPPSASVAPASKKLLEGESRLTD